MVDKEFLRVLTRIDKLETSNRLRGGHDYPAIIGYWQPNVSGFDPSGGGQTTSTSVVPLYNAVLPMQNPKMAFRFYYHGAGGFLSSWNITETVTGAVLATGSTTSTTYVTIEKHIDISAIFVYGQMANYSLNVVSAAGGTFTGRPEYVGGSWTPDAAVPF